MKTREPCGNGSEKLCAQPFLRETSCEFLRYFPRSRQRELCVFLAMVRQEEFAERQVNPPEQWGHIQHLGVGQGGSQDAFSFSLSPSLQQHFSLQKPKLGRHALRRSAGSRSDELLDQVQCLVELTACAR